MAVIKPIAPESIRIELSEINEPMIGQSILLLEDFHTAPAHPWTVKEKSGGKFRVTRTIDGMLQEERLDPGTLVFWIEI